MSAAMMDKKCQRCGTHMTVRVADHKRGWGKFCSKSCKAIQQEQRTGQYQRLQNNQCSGGNFDNTRLDDCP